MSTETLNGNSLTRVLTPKVAAHPDGVHLQIKNRLAKDAAFFTKPNGSIYDRIPKGKSNQVELLAPGTAKIGCSLPEDADFKYASFEVVEGNSGYKSTDLECKPGAEPRFIMSVASGAGSKLELVSYRDPVEQARKYFSEGLKEGDVVEEAGYPEDPNPPVRVVRNGKVVATIGSYEMGGGVTYCDGQI